MSKSNNLSEQEKERYLEAFQMFDKDGLGMVSPSDLGSMMRSLGKNPTSDELQGNSLFQFFRGTIIHTVD